MITPARRKIWELWNLQCPILGTCLGMAELRKLARKVNADIPAKATDHDLHVFFVRECQQEGQVSACITKYLDRKYRKDVRLFAKATEETALTALWDQAFASGDIPGPFWALMSHPRAEAVVMAKAYGQVHMLSHLMGAANRADIRRLARLTRRETVLTQALERLQAVRKAQKLQWAVRVRELEDRLEDERQERAKLARRLREQDLPDQAGPGADALAARRLVEDLREQTRRQAATIEDLYRENAGLGERLRETAADLERAESELARVLPCAGGAACSPGECPDRECRALMGKNVLYVGGRCSLVRHYRELVERLGCRFHHHDGGLESSPAELHGKLATADVVLCPVDCVSHEACLTVKKACKTCMKPFHMLRSSGLSALARTLDQLAARAN